MKITISIDCDKKTVNILDECGLERLQRENEKIAVDSVALDKIIKLIDEFKDTKTKTHSQVTLYTLIWEISDIIDERGD